MTNLWLSGHSFLHVTQSEAKSLGNVYFRLRSSGYPKRSTLRPYITISFMIYDLFFFVIQRSFSDEDVLLRTPSEKSRKHKVGVTEILRFTLDDNLLFLKLLKGLKGLSSSMYRFLWGSLENILPL